MVLVLAVFPQSAEAFIPFLFAGSADTIWCQCGGSSGGGQNVAQTVTSGSLLILMITADGDYTDYTVSDTQGNAWTRQTFSTSGSTQLSLTLYTAFASATGTATVTAYITGVSSPGRYKLIFLEYSGVVSIISANSNAATTTTSASGTSILSLTGSSLWRIITGLAMKVRTAPGCNTLGFTGLVTQYTSSCTFVVNGYYNSAAANRDIDLTTTPVNATGTWAGDCTNTCDLAHSGLAVNVTPPDTPIPEAFVDSLGGGVFAGIIFFFFLFGLIFIPVSIFSRSKNQDGTTNMFLLPGEIYMVLCVVVLIGAYASGLLPVWIPLLVTVAAATLLLMRGKKKEGF